MPVYGFGTPSNSAGQYLPGEVYAFGQRTRLNGKNDLYTYAQNLVNSGKAPADVARELSNNPFGISYQELSGITRTAPASANRTAAPAGGAGGSGAAKVDKSNSINLQLAGLGALDTQTATGLSSIEQALARLVGQYDTEASTNEKNAADQSTTNQSNLQRNKQTALVNASQGRQGLFGTLSSLGALSGSGIDLANRAVQKGANDDLSGAADNFSENQQNIDTAIGQFRQEDKMRRENASTSAENAKQNVRNDAAKQRMEFLRQLADDYTAMGDTASAKRYADQAAGLYPEVARTNVPNANLTYSGASFTPTSLANYIAGADSTQVRATPTGGSAAIPGLIASPNKKKERQAVA